PVRPSAGLLTVRQQDPKLLYAVEGIKAYHIAHGAEQSLTPNGPQTLSLLMVPTSSVFADPSGVGSGEEDFYLHLNLPPELDLPMPATTQIYHQPPTSYLIPRWDLGPASGAFTRIEFPPLGSRPGLQEDVDTFETILAQCTAFLERAPAPRPGPEQSKAAGAKAREAADEELPPYNPADYTPGEGYVQGSHSSGPSKGGRIVLVDEQDGSVIGELSDGFQVVEDGAVRPGSKDPVEIALPSDGTQTIAVQPMSVEDGLHPAYKKSSIVTTASKASRLLVTTSDYVTKTLQSQANGFTKSTQPVAKPVTFNPTTHAHIRRINQFSNKAVGLSATTVGSVTKVAQNLGALVARRRDGRAMGYDKDGNIIDSYKPGVLNKSLMAFSTVVDGVEQAGRNLLTGTSSSVTTVVGHRWGPEAAEVSRNLGGSIKNVGLVYIDAAGVSRRAILLGVAKGMVVGKVKGGGQVIVGGDDGVPTSGGNGNGNGKQARRTYGDAASIASGSDPTEKKRASRGREDEVRERHPVARQVRGHSCVDTSSSASSSSSSKASATRSGRAERTRGDETPSPTRLPANPAQPPCHAAMLHEILLSLSGHPSPLLGRPGPESHALAGVPPPERQLLATAAHLSDLHIKLITCTAQVSASHPSTICRAVAAAMHSVHLSAFQQKVLEVEETILRDDPALVGAYSIVPLTAVMGEFQQWTRRMEWLWETLRFIVAGEKDAAACQGAALINRLRTELQTGYQDVAETALSLVTVAETAWLKQVAAWVLYGRLPSFGGGDFFVQGSERPEEDFTCVPERLPSFVTPATASSMLFIGKSLNHVRAVGNVNSGVGGLHHISSKLQELGSLSFPLNSASFARTVASIRLSLSENTLQKILPLAKVVEMLQLLREFFLLGRGEFALALTREADEKIRNRWRRAGNLAYEKDDGLKNVTVKDGEVAAALNRTWAVLASMQGQHAEEDEQLELARDLLRLQLVKSRPSVPMSTEQGLSPDAASLLETAPFRTMLFSVPAMLSVELPSPLDMVISPSDLQIYSCVNSYLLSLRRAHIRLTDLWKMTSLRRHHPGPRGAGEHAVLLRKRWSTRSSCLRSSWTTASAAIFFLGETEAYLQTEIVEGMWEAFSAWLTGNETRRDRRDGAAAPARHATAQDGADGEDEDEDVFMHEWNPTDQRKEKAGHKKPTHDPQTLSIAHTLYLRTLVHRLLLTQPTFTQPLHALLIHIDHLVSHIQRLHSIFTSIDLETDAGVVDAFVDLEREEREVMALLRRVEGKVRKGIEEVVDALRLLESDSDFLAEWEGDGAVAGDDGSGEGQAYAPGRIGGVNRLLMKLDFGSWLGSRHDGWDRNE
ncbi:Uncharacterized protein TCAP_01159, partial [Tolypocladium capitatum]